MCAQGLCKDAKPTTHTQTLTLQIFLQFITTAHKLQTPHLPYERFAGFAKRSKSPIPLPFNERSVCFALSLASHQPFQIRTIPRKALPPLPPLSKGGGLTARHKLLSCCVLIATHPPFYSPNFSAVKTEGLLYTTNPPRNALPLEVLY